MVLSDQERDAILSTVAELETVASVQPEHSTTRLTLYRLAANFRHQLTGSVVTSTFRGTPVKKG